jgi:hypothetical protein
VQQLPPPQPQPSVRLPTKNKPCGYFNNPNGCNKGNLCEFLQYVKNFWLKDCDLSLWFFELKKFRLEKKII